MTVFLLLLLNLAVGVCIGLTGIAGFLLPMFYTGGFGLPTGISLIFSFSAFLISGLLGSRNYFKAGNLDLRTACVLSIGSLCSLWRWWPHCGYAIAYFDRRSGPYGGRHLAVRFCFYRDSSNFRVSVTQSFGR